MATILVTGATGFIGRAMVAERLTAGDQVVALTRDPAAARALLGAEVICLADLADIDLETRIDAIVNLAGAPTGRGLWSARRRALLLGSRLAVTDAVLALISRLKEKPKVLVSASATGFYGDRGDERLTEDSGPQDRFMSDLCRLWEDRARRAEAMGVRVCCLRIGVVFSWDGGPLPFIALPARWGLGAVLGSGRQWLPWVHEDDMVRLIAFTLKDERCAGAFNAVAPDLITQRDFIRAISRSLRRPQWLTLPAWLLRLALGEYADLALASQKVSADRVLALGFRFLRPTLAEGLAQTQTGPGLASGPREALA